MKIKGSLALVAVVLLFISCQKNTGEWVSLFDGKTLDGWKANEKPESFSVEDGAIKCSGPRSHLFLDGKTFTNFELEAEVKTLEYANSGIFICTEYQDSGWLLKGHEVQINNSYRGPETNPELRKTGSLYAVRNVYYPLVADNEWFKIRVKVEANQARVFVNDVMVVDYIEADDAWRPEGHEKRRLGPGMIALQAHDPGSTTYFRNIRIRELPEAKKMQRLVDKVLDDNVTKLMFAGFPLIDYHVHLKGGLTLAEAVQNSLKLGINYGIAPNCGLNFPITDDKSLYAYLDSVKLAPVFKGMQAEGREWITLFSPEAVASFDYVFTDALTWTDNKGRRNRIWIPEEVWIEDKQQFMDLLVEKTVAILTQEPVDIYVNPTFLPAALSPEYDQLWTDERKKKVIDVLLKNQIALEINARYKIPSADFIKMAKEAGVKFTFGTNNAAADLGQLDYCLRMLQECKLTPANMFEPKPDGKKPVQVKGLPTKVTG